MTASKPAVDHVNWLKICFFIAIPILIAYANTFNFPWQFDDAPNIANNSPLHIDNLMPATLWQTFFAKPGHHAFYRPVACLTFALNWYMGEGDTTVYHVFNIGIHTINAIILFQIILSLLSIRMRDRFSSAEAYFIALFSTMMWALNPVQTMAVTYIVQRMAQLAALFYLLGILFYIRARLSETKRWRWLHWAGCSICYLLAVLSKENAAIMPLGLLLIEAAFFQPLDDPQRRRKMAMFAVVMTAAIAILGSLVFLNGNILSTLNDSGSRMYTPLQRLISQPRILVFYLSQLFYPLPSRLSVEHDIFFSPTIWSPWPTLPSLLIIGGAILVCFFRFHRAPIVCFALLFFIVNHAIESSIINLELVFEHRNYLPSLFLFVPVAVGMDELLKRYRQINVLVFGLIAALATAVLFSFGFWTYQRNTVWQTSQTLWLDAMQKAPGQARPVNHIAIDMAWSDHATNRDRSVAIHLFEKSLEMQTARKDLEADIYGNIGNIYFQMGQLDKAVSYQRKALSITPQNKKLRVDLIQSFIMQGEWQKALPHTQALLEPGRLYASYYNLNGFVLLWLQKPTEALKYFRQALKMEPFKPNIVLNIGVALSHCGSYANADWFFKLAHKVERGDLGPLMALIENSDRAGDHDHAAFYAQQLLSRHPVPLVLSTLKKLPRRFDSVPIDGQTVARYVREGANVICKP